MVQKNAKFNSFSADENLAFPFKHEGKKPCHKPCSTGDMQIFKIISDTVSKTKNKLLFRCKYYICSWVLLVAKWQLNGSTEKKSVKIPQQVQLIRLPTRTGQADASWEPERCHSWDAVKKTWGVRQPQTGWDKQATECMVA